MDFFVSKQHLIVPSGPIVVKNDPSLLFTNAGMNQFKDYFLGNKVPPAARIADTQKCLRVSGKHNDLEEVGVDTYHHTMFEMLGNWSFGNPAHPGEGYFKEEAIQWSWELLTDVFKIPKDRLYATVFEGDAKEGLPASTIALAKWKTLLPDNQIVFGNKKDNFWEMGDAGPCGPCSEIHIDCRSDEERAATPGELLVNKDHPQVIEIWNNVFIQFNRKKDGSLEPLPANHVDTGMGFERLVRVLQNKKSNYDTDVFTGTIKEIEKITGKIYDASLTVADSKKPAGSSPAGGGWEGAVAFRVLADHIRAIGFTIADGQLPSNTGAGYVIRRILRRAVRYYYSYLEYQQPLLYQLLPVIATQFETVFPELKAQQEFVAKVIKEEEEAFLRTLEKGLKRMDAIINTHKNGSISGSDAFELLDTFGFPIDLTRLIAAENNLLVDDAGFEREMKEQKDRSRAATALDTEDWQIVNEGNSNGFMGYDTLEIKTKILRYRKVSGKGKQLYQLVLQDTAFYAESGGQVGDSGQLAMGNGQLIKITDTKKENDLIIHFAETIPSELSGEIIATVDAARRKDITVHHSVTHLMHAALRKVLGTHVAQKGSLVNVEHLRFDFSHFAKMTDEEILATENMVNEKIRDNIPVVIKSMHKEEAIALGAMALFGEKYGDTVRVVMMDPAYSIELCGGTHVGNTGELGVFKIKTEGAVAAGVRRIEAVCGVAAQKMISDTFVEINAIRSLLKNPADIQKSLESLLADNNTLGKRIESLEARQLVVIRNEIMQKDAIINNVSFIGEIIEVPNADALKKLCFDLKNHLHDHLVVLCANIGGKAHVAVSVSETVVVAKNLDAAKIIKEIVSPLIKGGGGGQKNLATAGGQDVGNFATLINKVKELI